jgi:hypothetical protein
MYIVTTFTVNGEPKLDLNPKICINNIDTSEEIICRKNMSEIGNGFYKYDFTGIQKNVNYTVLCDGGMELHGSERYKFQIIEVDRLRGVTEK